MSRFPLEMFASLELNHVAFPKTGRVISQTPLGEEFTAEAPCENGMWVSASVADGTVHSVEAATDAVGIVYTAEKEYDMNHYGLKTFGRKIAGDYPRVGILSVGDTVTTNCLDLGEFSDVAAVETALTAGAVYVVPVVGSAVPKLTATATTEGACGRVIKIYTVPNGEKGVKYEMIRV